MVKTTLTHDRSQAGFTLVELAIVMIIIGLLIGGILKGQELIQNAQVTSTASQVKAIEAAITTFRDSYAAVPGDMRNPGNRLPNCPAGSVCNVANAGATGGNNRIDQAPSVAAGAGTEATRFWSHLAAADLIGGVDYASTDLSWGAALPAAEIGGGFVVGYAGVVADLAGAGPATINSGHYLSLRNTAGTAVANTNANAPIRPTQAARIDRKLDDGAPNSGSVLAAGPAACATAGVNGTYVENTGTVQCQLYLRVQ